MARIIRIRLHGQGQALQADPGDLDLHLGDRVMVEQVNGLDYAYCASEPYELPGLESPEALIPILGLTTEEEDQEFQRLLMDERTALRLARGKVEELGLEMDLVKTDIIFDRKRMLFYFTAEGRVDFRELVRQLAALFKTRIELRQIGVRDEARLIGALGCCGRELCCTSFLKDFHPVSIKMAKEQNLSMNPGKISGACGRLLCCLQFEQAAYVDARDRLPYKNDLVRCALGEGTVESVNLLRETLNIRIQGKEATELVTVPASEVVLLHSAKKRRNAKEKGERSDRVEGTDDHEKSGAADERPGQGRSRKRCPKSGECHCPMQQSVQKLYDQDESELDFDSART